MGWNQVIDVFISLGNAAMALINIIKKIAFMVPRIVELINYIFNIPRMLTDILFGLTKGSLMVLETLFKLIFGDIFNSDRDKESNFNKLENTEDSINLGSDIVEILILIMCPPLAIILKQGWRRGWLIMLITSVLTYLYYFPGLIYAALYVM